MMLNYDFGLSIFTATGSEQYGQLPNRTSYDLQHKHRLKDKTSNQDGRTRASKISAINITCDTLLPGYSLHPPIHTKTFTSSKVIL